MAAKVVLLLLVIVMVICGGCKADVYKVGDSSGWTNVKPLNYKSWAASKTFHVGDVLLFEYNKQFQDVVRVTHKNFNACNSTAPYGSWSTGNDSFRITRPGHFYFICSFPGHCQLGQKVDIRVLKDDRSGPAPTPSYSGPTQRGPLAPSPSISGPLAPSPSPESAPPVQSHKSGCSSMYSSLKLRLFVVAVGLLAIAA